MLSVRDRRGKMTGKKHPARRASKQAASNSSKDSRPPQQLELDFRAPLLTITWPDPETQEFWRATAEEPDEFVRRIARFSRRIQAYESASLRNQES